VWIAISCVLTALVSICSLVVACLAVLRANRALASPQVKQDSIESRMRLLAASVEEHAEALETLAESIRMSRVRRKANNHAGSSGEPDARTDPEAWRNWMNQQLRNAPTKPRN